MIQFVAVIPITDKSSEKLAGLFYDIYVIRSILFLDIIWSWRVSMYLNVFFTFNSWFNISLLHKIVR